MGYVYETFENCIKDQSKSLEEYARILVEYPETKKYFDDELLKKVEDEINRLLSNDQEFIDFVQASKGFCVACHPFRNNNRGLEENLKTVQGLGGIEVLNGSTDLEANRKALKYCRELGLQPIGASDGHWESNVGKYVTWIPEHVTTVEDFVRVMRTQKCKPAIWNDDHYDIVEDF